MFLRDLHKKRFNKSRNPDDWTRFKKLRNDINSISMKKTKEYFSKSCKRTEVTLRRISCHGQNHLHTRCEYLQTIFLCYHCCSECCYLVENFQLICYSQRVNATSQYNDSGSSRCSKWPNDRIAAVVKNCWLLVQGKRRYRGR